MFNPSCFISYISYTLYVIFKITREYQCTVVQGTLEICLIKVYIFPDVRRGAQCMQKRSSCCGAFHDSFIWKIVCNTAALRIRVIPGKNGAKKSDVAYFRRPVGFSLPFLLCRFKVPIKLERYLRRNFSSIRKGDKIPWDTLAHVPVHLYFSEWTWIDWRTEFTSASFRKGLWNLAAYLLFSGHFVLGRMQTRIGLRSAVVLQ